MTNRFVLDACALAEFLGSQNCDPALYKRIRTGVIFAPAIIDLETLNTIHKWVRRGSMTVETADGFAENVRDIPIARSGHQPLLPRIWQLRHSITTYDAAYVALAEELDIPLVTCDAKLGGANSHHAKIEVYPTS